MVLETCQQELALLFHRTRSFETKKKRNGDILQEKSFIRKISDFFFQIPISGIHFHCYKEVSYALFFGGGKSLNFYHTPWKMNGWFTYSHHPFCSKEKTSEPSTSRE